VTGERARGALLYAGAAVVLAVGGGWWLRAAPRTGDDPRISQWQASVERLLPKDARAQAGDTLELPAGVDHEVVADLSGGDYVVSVVCEGGTQSQVRISLGQDDSGRGLACGTDHRADTFQVGLAGQLRMKVSVGANGPVVFRYEVRPDD
jgi:hypothetical protein